jgi:hypothetical protein
MLFVCFYHRIRTTYNLCARDVGGQLRWGRQQESGPDSRWLFRKSWGDEVAQPEGPYRVSNTGLFIVIRLVKPFCVAKRNIMGNNCFTSVPLAKNLIKEKQLTHMLVHFVRTNERYQKNFYGISRGEECH